MNDFVSFLLKHKSLHKLTLDEHHYDLVIKLCNARIVGKMVILIHSVDDTDYSPVFVEYGGDDIAHAFPLVVVGGAAAVFAERKRSCKIVDSD